MGMEIHNHIVVMYFFFVMNNHRIYLFLFKKLLTYYKVYDIIITIIFKNGRNMN